MHVAPKKSGLNYPL